MVRSNIMTCLMMSCLLRVQFCAKNRASCDVLQKDSRISPGQFVLIFRNIINEIVIHIFVSYKQKNGNGTVWRQGTVLCLLFTKRRQRTVPCLQTVPFNPLSPKGNLLFQRIHLSVSVGSAYPQSSGALWTTREKPFFLSTFALARFSIIVLAVMISISVSSYR